MAESEDEDKSAGSSPKHEDDQEIVYYYSREHRLSRASQAVRELNDEKPAKAGFVRSVAGTRGNLFMLVAILIVCMAIIFSSRSSRLSSEEFLLGGNTVSLRIESVKPEAAASTASSEGFILFITKKAPQKETGYTGVVDFAISPVLSAPAEGGETAPIMNHRVFFTFNDKEEYSVALPFGGEAFLVAVQTEDERVIRRITSRN